MKTLQGLDEFMAWVDARIERIVHRELTHGTMVVKDYGELEAIARAEFLNAIGAENAVSDQEKDDSS